LVEKLPSASRFCPFLPSRRDMGVYDDGVEHLHQVSGLAQGRHDLKVSLKHARLAQAPKALLVRVPVAGTLGQGSPGDVADGEGLQCLQEAAVIAALGAAPAALGGKHPQHRCPVVLRHSGGHGRTS
jgi:hypothetical protein